MKNNYYVATQNSIGTMKWSLFRKGKNQTQCICLMLVFTWSRNIIWGFQLGKTGCERPLTIRRSQLGEDQQQLIVGSVPENSMSRRKILQILSLIGIVPALEFSKDSCLAVDEVLPSTSQTLVVEGKIFLPADVTMDSSAVSSAALYVTVRPDTPDNVPAAILSGTRGKPPPVMAARFPSPTFPFEFQLTAPNNLTPEGASGIADIASLQEISSFWWANDNLIVSARWDSDGVAATRSPEDLVGRANFRRTAGIVAIPLTGRGSFGKFVTNKDKK
jgi:hypothetical protein